MTHSDWELQRGRLSAYLDSELTVSERAVVEAHLPTCEQCQSELAALRQTRALLRALPTPTPPRAFTLPATTTIASSRRGVPPAWARPAQALGSIAAMIGLGLLITTALLGRPHGGVAGGASMASSALAPSNASAPVTTSPSSTVEGQAALPSPANTPAHEPSANTDSSFGSAEPAQPFPIAPVTGVTLLVGGAAAVAVGSLARRRGGRAA